MTQLNKPKRPETPSSQPLHKIGYGWDDNKQSSFDFAILRIAFLIALITTFPVYGMLRLMVSGAPLLIAFVTIEASVFVAALLVLMLEW